jgi:hypothetical protein
MMEFIIILIVLILGIVCGIIMGKKFGIRKKDDKITINSVVKEILPISEYASLIYHYSSVVSHWQVNKFFKIIYIYV